MERRKEMHMLKTRNNEKKIVGSRGRMESWKKSYRKEMEIEEKVHHATEKNTRKGLPAK